MLAHCGIVKLIVPSRRGRCNLGRRVPQKLDNSLGAKFAGDRRSL